MPNWMPPPPLSFDHATAAAFAVACRRAADDLARIGAERAAVLARVQGWEGPRRAALDDEERRIGRRWSEVEAELRRAVGAVNDAADRARIESRRREDEQIRWHLEAGAEREAAVRAEREAAEREAADHSTVTDLARLRG